MNGATTSRLRTMSGLRLPALILAMLCGGVVFTAVFVEEPAEYPGLSVLASPALVGSALLAAIAFSALFVAGMRADRRLARQRLDRREAERNDLMRRLAGEEFTRRWTSEPVLCNRVEELRRHRGIAPEQLAIVLGLSARSLIRIEKGIYAPSIALAFMIAEFFEQPVGDVFRPETPHSRSGSRRRP